VTIVRRATSADVPALQALLAVTWRDTYGAFAPLAAIERTTAAWHAPHVLEAELARPTTFTGVAEDAEVGMAGMVTAHAGHEVLEIARLYVRPDAQRRGHGGRLLATARAAYPDLTHVRLEVEAQNPKGRTFYRKVGFVETGERTVEAFGIALRLVSMELRGGATVGPAT
jgi:ribosomal protein S18 acetylase RimI-like enzyme